MDITDEVKEVADRAFELLEMKSPHQLAVELVELQRKHNIALSALNKLQDQRDQLVAQLTNATARCGVMVDLLREGLDAGDPNYYYGSDLMGRIEAALAGKLPEHAERPFTMMPDGWQLVPIIPTQEMLTVGALYPDSYADMLAAAKKAL